MTRKTFPRPTTSTAGAPPFLIFQGTNDEFLDYHTHIDFQKKLQDAGDVCDLVIYKGKSHFQVVRQDMEQVTGDFLKEHLTGK